MDILSYLLELLQQRKEVGITGLGTFYKKKYPGRYDKEKQTFLPPGYTLQFSSDLTEEKALVDFIAAKRNISNENANDYITQFVEEVNQKLELDHEVELENTGRLFFTEQGLDFEPIKNINYGSEFYGLPSLPETVTEDVKPDSPKEEEEVYDEIAEAPGAPSPFENKSYQAPVIENVELDEVNDDLKNTLKHTEKGTAEIIEAPEFIKEQHEEHPSRFGHTPESEVENIAAEHQAVEASHTDETEHLEDTAVASPVEEANEVEVPQSIVEQHEEKPDRFGHTPEAEAEKIAEEPVEKPIPDPVLPQQEYSSRFSLRPETEEPKTYIHLEDEAKKEEPVIEAPAFIKEQHAEHPNRFGHDPIEHGNEARQGMSTWLMITIAVLALAVIAAITFLVKPELFTGETAEVLKPAPVIVDSPKVVVDTLKAKQDSIAKTDSILKANQLQKRTDTVKKEISKPAVKPAIETPKENNVVPKTGPSTFDVIAASYKTVAGAEKYIAIMKTRGLNAKIANMAGPWKKVSIGSFKTQKEAEEQKDILQKKLKGKGFYVQQIFNNTQP